MQEITNCAICFSGYTPENPAVYEPVYHHACHRECWDGWIQEQNMPVHKRWYEYIFGNWNRYPDEAYYTSCPTCREWVRSDELRLDTGCTRTDPITPPHRTPSVCYVLGIVATAVVWSFYVLVSSVINFFLPCRCPEWDWDPHARNY